MANRFPCDVIVIKQGTEINGKSIMGIMMLAASRGTWIIVEASGDDEADAMAAIEDLIGSRFGEDE
jgi:phosphocarrier protein